MRGKEETNLFPSFTHFSLVFLLCFVLFVFVCVCARSFFVFQNLQMVTELIHHSTGKTSSKTQQNSNSAGKPLKGAMKVIKKLKGRIGLGEFSSPSSPSSSPSSCGLLKRQDSALLNCSLPALFLPFSFFILVFTLIYTVCVHRRE